MVTRTESRRLVVDEIAHEVVTASRALLAIAIRSVNSAPVDITPTQHRALVLLAGRGDQPVGALAAELGVNASNASRLCDRLQRLGLVSRRRSDDDARSVRIAITDAGRAVLRAVHAHRLSEVRAVLETMSEPEARGVVDVLRVFNEAAHEAAPGDWLLPHDRTDGS